MIIRLREWRERRGLSIRGLAARAGVGFATVYRIEAGLISPTVAMLDRLAKALAIDLVDLFPPKRKSRRAHRRLQ